MISPLRIALMRIAALPDVRGEISAQARLTSVHRTDRTQTSCGFAKMEQRTRSIRPIATFNMIFSPFADQAVRFRQIRFKHVGS